MPSPTETLLRVQASPLPTHTIFGLEGSMVTAPIDCTSGLSNTDLKVVPPLIDFHTPPLAAAAKTVSWPCSLIASTAAMRPLILADPILRADKPEMVEESNLTGACAAAVIAHTHKHAHAKPLTRRAVLTQEEAIISLKSSYSRSCNPIGQVISTCIVISSRPAS